MKTSELADSAINLGNMEMYFQIGGMEYGMHALSKLVADYYIKSDPKVAAFVRYMQQKYDTPLPQGNPASDNNMPRKDLPGVNYFAVRKLLTEIVSHQALISVRADRKKYTDEWLEECLTELMKSEYRDTIAEQWRSQKLKIIGGVLGALRHAGVLQGSSLNIATLYSEKIDTEVKAKTLAKYMGDMRHCDYTQWMDDYALLH